MDRTAPVALAPREFLKGAIMTNPRALHWRRLRRGLTLPALLLAVWWAAFHFGWAHTGFFVPPQKVWRTAIALTDNGYLVSSLLASLRRDLIGFALGASAGLLFGTLLGLSRWAENLLAPTFNTIKQVSLLAWIPLISLWFGLGDPAKVVFLSLAAFFPVVLNTFEGIRSVPRELIEVARVFAYSRRQLVRRVVLPAALPSIFTGVYLALIYAWLATLGAEYLLSSGTGIGNLMTDGREHFWMDQVILGVIVVGLVGFVLNTLADIAERHLLGWRGSTAGRY
jgi:sulfonate transport system permease protein